MPIQERFWFRDQVHAHGRPCLDPRNRAFRHGDGLFETILVRHGGAVALEMHLDRLAAGMEVLGFDLEGVGHSKASWRELLGSVVERLTQGQDAAGFGRIRLTVYRQGEGRYLPQQDGPELLAEIEALDADPWTLRPPLHLCIAHSYPIVPSVLSQVKSLNSLPYVLAARHAAAEGMDDAILRNPRGEVAECTASNLFLVIQNRILTPWLGSGCLPGVMRARVMEAAKALGWLVQAQPLQLARLSTASEIFLTNAIQGLQPVGSITETKYLARHHPVMSMIRDSLLAEGV
ncbi:MAG: hypothetical protein RLZZ165_772 [Bacteroidota bacterium]|jgi:branched-chain amino acid aminotransferase